MQKYSYNNYVSTNPNTMEKLYMEWSKQTKDCWKAFENAVLNRDKKQFELYHKYVLSQQNDKQLQQENEEELLN